MIQTISVLGAGTMGHAIASVFAMHGYSVSLYECVDSVRASAMDRITDALSFMADEDYIPRSTVQASLRNISLYADLAQAVKNADYVIEATPEDLALKQALFQQLDGLCPPHTIFASNTSSLSLSEMYRLLPEARRAKTMVCHWYNPGHLIPIVELSAFGNMSEADFNDVWEMYIRSEKQPVKVLKDIPGLIANRILHAQAREVFSLIEQGVASADDIDRALKFGPGFRSATTGMLETADMGGLDIWCTVEDNLFPALDAGHRACDMMRKSVEAGNLGVKTGKGFFDYPPEVRDQMRNAFHKRLIAQLKVSKQY